MCSAFLGFFYIYNVDSVRVHLPQNPTKPRVSDGMYAIVITQAMLLWSGRKLSIG